MQAAQAQARADDERRREGDLRDGQAVAEPDRDAPFRHAGRRQQPVDRAHARGDEPRHEPDDHRDQDQDRGREQCGRRIDPDFGKPRNVTRRERLQHAEGQGGQRQPAGGTGGAQQARFGHEQLHDRPPGSAERQTDRDLAPARQRAQQRHDRDVDARNQQHGRCGGHQRAERQEHAAELPLPQRVEADAAACLRGIGGGQIALEIAGDALEIAPRVGGAHAGAKTSNRRQIVIGAIGGIARRQIERQPGRHVGLGIGEPGRHDAGDGVLDAIQPDAAGERVLAPTEVALPEVVTDDGDRLALRIGGRDRPAEDRADAERGEQLRCHAGDLDALGEALATARCGERHAPQIVGRDRCEGPLALAVLAHLGARQHASVVDAPILHVVQRDEPVRRGVGRLLQHDAVEHAEEGRIGAHPEREGQDGDDGKGGRAEQLPDGVAEFAHAAAPCNGRSRAHNAQDYRTINRFLVNRRSADDRIRTGRPTNEPGWR